MLNKRDIRKAKRYEEISEYFNLDKELLKTAVPSRRLSPKDESQALKKARETIRNMFMSPRGIKLHDKILTSDLKELADVERSSSWKEYIFVCINGERRSFQRIFFYDRIINCIVKQMLKSRENLVILDYGCGSSLFTRMLSQDFGGRIKTISADVCKYAVELSVARNKIYNPSASGFLIENVFSVLQLSGIDLILAYAVFEHLPNATHQIQGLIDSLSPGGILIENYSGQSTEEPYKSDTFNAYSSRDINLDLLNSRLTLLYGVMPKKQNGAYCRDSGDRFWIKEPANQEFIVDIRKKMRRQNSFFRRVLRVFNKFVKSNLL